jgi:hypothetical protein
MESVRSFGNAKHVEACLSFPFGVSLPFGICAHQKQQCVNHLTFAPWSLLLQRAQACVLNVNEEWQRIYADQRTTKKL